MRRETILALALGVAVLGAVTAGAEIPRLVNYQGILTDAAGAPLDGLYELTFTIYPDSSQSAAALWTEWHREVPVQNGLFNIILGSSEDLTDTHFSGGERWLGISVGTDPEIWPRMQLTATPYTFRAAIADSALGASSSADGDWTVSGDDQYSAVAGNVGIGTTAPGKKLQIGDMTVPDAEGMIRLASRSGTNSSQRTWDVGVPETDGDSGGIGYSFVIDDLSNGDDPEFMVKWGTGLVGIGTYLPDAHLHVIKGVDSGAGSALEVQTYYDLGILTTWAALRFDRSMIDAYGQLGDINLSLNRNSSGNVHLVTGGGDVGIGLAGAPEARLHVDGNVRADRVEIAGADVAERFPVRDAAEPGMVVAIDPDRPGGLQLCRRAYDRTVAGVVSGAGDLEPGAVLGHRPGQEEALPIALTGRVWVRCDATDVPIEAGDLLTTSTTHGHAAKVIDHDRAQGAVIGKAMTPLAEGRGLVLVLVSLQ